ncbi:YodC family protein [Spartinivicinus poritis]|uniref:YodC family protein n=1 Tax=Spartinivicinus poritis TaxID=2994640 RepID=UPI003CC91C0F
MYFCVYTKVRSSIENFGKRPHHLDGAFLCLQQTTSLLNITMDTTNLFTGSLVRLKSGGPLMTVINVNSYSVHVECRWFDGATPHKDVFPKSALEQVNSF